MSKEIFISHAVKDKPLADAFVDLLQLGLNVDSTTIFCSSLEGMGIPSGENFIEHIKKQIQAPKAVLALISPNYYGSQFCLCELGATWILSHRLFPLLVPPLRYADVQGVLTAVQVTSINSEEKLSELRDQLLETLGIAGAQTARWEVKRGKFLKDLPKILKKLPVLETVPLAEHAKVKADLAGAKKAIADVEDERERLEAMIKKLERAKDKKEVLSIKAAHQPAAKTQDELEKALANRLKKLPRSVSLVACKRLGLDQRVRPDVFRDKEFAEEIHDAAGEELVTIDDDLGDCELNSDHPQIKAVTNAYKTLYGFLEGAPKELRQAFESEHEMPLSLKNRKYWEWALDNRIKAFSV